MTRAVRIRSFGGPEVLEVVEVPDPIAPDDGSRAEQRSIRPTTSSINANGTHYYWDPTRTSIHGPADVDAYLPIGVAALPSDRGSAPGQR